MENLFEYTNRLSAQFHIDSLSSAKTPLPVALNIWITSDVYELQAKKQKVALITVTGEYYSTLN